MDKCFGCGKFVKLGEGKVTKVTYPDGSTRYFCEPCVTKRLEYKSKILGRPTTFNDYIGSEKQMELV